MPEKNLPKYYRRINIGEFDFVEHLKNPDPDLLFWILRFFKPESNINKMNVYVTLSPEEFNAFGLKEKHEEYSLMQAIKVISNESQMNMTFKEATITFEKFQKLSKS